MKLSSAFDGLARENQFLKMVVKWQFFILAVLAGIILSLCTRAPLLIERSSRGVEIVNAVELKRTQSDLKQAVGLMLKARFDSGAISPELFLNQKQIVLRNAEQAEMKARSMTQTIILRQTSFEKDQAFVDLDRVIAVGDIRSALKARVRVTFEEVSPNELNPFGLLLSLADPIEQKEKK